MLKKLCVFLGLFTGIAGCSPEDIHERKFPRENHEITYRVPEEKTIEKVLEKELRKHGVWVKDYIESDYSNEVTYPISRNPSSLVNNQDDASDNKSSDLSSGPGGCLIHQLKSY